MPQQIGLCCSDQIVTPPGLSGDVSGLNEIIPFTNQSQVVVQWNATRKLRFGNAGVFQVETLGEDGIYRVTLVDAVPNVIPNTAFYTFNFGVPYTGRIIVT